MYDEFFVTIFTFIIFIKKSKTDSSPQYMQNNKNSVKCGLCMSVQLQNRQPDNLTIFYAANAGASKYLFFTSASCK